MKKIAITLLCVVVVFGFIGWVVAEQNDGQVMIARGHDGGHQPGPMYPSYPPHHHHRPGPHGDCFIATAAYGTNDGHVFILREFRGRWLVTNYAGKLFISFYNNNGPQAAEWLRKHESIKPMVRIILLPAVGFAYLMNTMG